MKNRIWKKVKGLGFCTFFLTVSIWSSSEKILRVQAEEVNDTMPFLKESAYWTDAENYCGEVLMEMEVMQNSLQNEELQTENQTENQAENQEENQEENPTENQTEDIPPAEMITDIILDEEIPIPEISTDEAVVADDTEEAGQEISDEIQLLLINYISEYFQLNTASVPQGCMIEEIPVRNQKGEDTCITKITYPINIWENTEDNFTLSLPVILREEYRSNVTETLYPVSQDEPLRKDRAGTGVFLLEKYEGTESTIASFASPELSVRASVCDYLAELKADASAVKAGEVIDYILEVKNTGALPLSDISVKSEFSLSDIEAVWEASEGVQVNGKNAVISCLNAGESYRLRMTVKLTQDQSGELKNHVVLQAKHPGTAEEMIRETEDTTTVTPLTADFTVEKTADHTVAAPGDTVTYQICIRNTGEKTLHSVVGTERFLNAGIQAQFVPKNGVILNSTRTQALISSIAPGEAFALLATVTIPQNFTSQELVNEVIVRSEETGTRQIQAQSRITLAALQPTVTVTPLASSQGYYQTGNSSKSAYNASSSPKTGDDTPVIFHIALLVSAILSSVGIFAYRKRKSNVSKD